jgi:hypothetical protein
LKIKAHLFINSFCQDLIFNFTHIKFILFSDGFEVAQFSTNLRGNPQVVDRAGFEYSKHKGAWRCLRKSISDGRPCSARITTNGYQIVKRTGFHDHPAMYGKLK